jgi:hypothetical protein
MLAKYGKYKSFASWHGVSVERWAVLDTVGRTALLAGAPAVEQEIHARYPAS